MNAENTMTYTVRATKWDGTVETYSVNSKSVRRAHVSLKNGGRLPDFKTVTIEDEYGQRTTIKDEE